MIFFRLHEIAGKGGVKQPNHYNNLYIGNISFIIHAVYS